MAEAEPPAIAAADDGSEDKGKVDTPGNVESGGDEKNFDHFMSGTLPNGKTRKCTDFGCLGLVVSFLSFL